MAELREEAIKQMQDMRRKANVDLYPAQLHLQCGSIEIHSDKDLRHITIKIDGQIVTGVYSCHVNLNSQRLPKIELGVFLGDFNLTATPRGENA